MRKKVEEEWRWFEPKMELVKELLEIRRRAIRKGLELLTVDEVLDLVKRRKVGLGEEELERE